MRILIADDDSLNLTTLAAVLEVEGHSVFQAKDGADALGILDRQPVDTLISDILMPNMDGYRLCEEVRSRPKLNTLPIILYSGAFLSPNDRQLGLASGADAFLQKPATLATILQTIRKVTSKKHPHTVSQPNEEQHMKRYSERLVNKIEEQNIELAQLAEELRSVEEKFRQIIEHSTDVFWIAKPRMTEIVYVSPAYEVIWGRACGELYERPELWLKAVHEEDVERVRKEITDDGDFLDRGYETEFRIHRKDGATRWIRNRIFPVRDSSGCTYRIAGIASDVTNQKELENQYLEAQRMEAIGRLAGGVAHDFNNILTIIKGYSDLILDNLPQNDALYTQIQQIRVAGDRAVVLTRQLLAFSRTQVLQPIVLDINSIVVQIEKLLRRIIGEDIELTLDLDQTAGLVKVDAGQMEQIIANLAINSKDAMPNGGRLILKTRNMGPDEGTGHDIGDIIPLGRYVVFSISDTGTGIAPEIQSKIFEPYFTTKEFSKGTGLGLSAVLGIVEQSGGFIRFHSEKGVGTSFNVYLPRAEKEDQSRQLSTGSVKSLTGTETVLVIEDDDAVRGLVRLTLTGNGYKVLEASHGREAFSLASSYSGPIQLVLTDLVMPHLSGPATIRFLATLLPNTKVVYMSGYSEKSLDEQGITPEMPFLHKPFSPETLLRTIRTTLDQSANEIE